METLQRPPPAKPLTKPPTPKTDAMRAARETRYEQVKAAQVAARASKPKPVKRSKKKDS